MPVWLIIIIILVVVLFFVFARIGGKASKEAGREAARLLAKIEQKYDEFLDRKIRNRILTYSDFDINKDKIIDDALIILKPDIDGLIAHINATIYSSARTSYSATFFTNIPHLVNEMFVKSKKNKDNNLTKAEEEEMHNAFKDAIKADILQRLVRLREDGDLSP